MLQLRSEVVQKIKIPLSLVSNFEKFFKLIIPKDVEQIILLIPAGLDGETITTSINKVKPDIPIFVIESDTCGSNEILLLLEKSKKISKRIP
ncbi:DUF4898 domain-containing protein [Stygiolobus caldivivus]|uniref:DUF4898 domain-containing protein n=1 Tax=Stygiolobus caldivivus TaxID=2824673 RepID=UPI001C85C5E1|nr:DUF4898 domain-containing protein [Stygiolobus caldivivus]